jgi:hypothetical protein
MADLRKSITTAFVALVICSMAGCSDPAKSNGSGVQSAGDDADSGTRASSGTSELMLTAYTNLGESEMQRMSNPDAAQIEKLVRGMNWQNPQQRPYVHLARVGNGGSYLRLQGTQGTPNTDGIFRAIGSGILDAGWSGESAPLESVDAGLELLLLFLNDPEKLKPLLGEWATESSQ